MYYQDANKAFLFEAEEKDFKHRSVERLERSEIKIW